MRIIDLYLEHNLIRLDEANLKRLFTKSVNETPKMAQKGEQLSTSVRYFGLSQDGTWNFKVKSQTVPGGYYYVYIEAPDILRLGDITEQGDHLNEADLNRLLTMDGFRVHCGCPAWLYWAFQYMATQGNYEIEPETRAPKRNNVTQKGSICKHLSAVIKNIYENKQIRQALIKDLDNYLRMIEGMDYEDYQQLNHAKQIQQQNRAVKWKNKPSDYMNEYFARKAKNHSFLDDHDIKHSLKMEINKFIKSNPQANVDDFLRSYFQMTQKAFAEDMKIPEDAVEDYFNELGFEQKKEKVLAKSNPQPQINNQPTPQASGVKSNIITHDSEQLPHGWSYLDLYESDNTKYYDSEEEAREAYDKYIKGHVANVQEALEVIAKLDIPFVTEHLEELREIVKHHDESKWGDKEYIPYLHHFYPTNEDEANMEEEFDNAVMLHVQNNKHHWNCIDWLDPTTGELRPDIDETEYKLYTVERCCDWSAMSYQHEEDYTDYFNKHKKEFIQPDYAIQLEEEILNKIPKDTKLKFKITRGDLDETEQD